MLHSISPPPGAYGPNENREPSRRLVYMVAEHSAVTQQVGPLSQKHTTITGTTGDQTHCPFLNNAILGVMK
jgi:hypothetical protein